MSSKLFTYLFIFAINFCFLLSSGYRITAIRHSEESEDNDTSGNSNDANIFRQSLENDSITTIEGDELFWTVTPEAHNEEIRLNETEPVETNEETEILEGNEKEAANDTIFTSEKPIENLELEQMTEESMENGTSSSENDAMVGTTDEKITLERTNCNLEIMLPESNDLKIQITFGKLENNTSGKCCITLNGEENTMLGVLISNVHLYQNASQGEVLKVVTADYGTDFILKEYYSWNKYQPLLLTETHRVYIILQYKVTNIPLNKQQSHFNLEVFSYYKNENDIQQETSYSQSFSLPKYDTENFHKKEKPVFIPYFY